MNFVIVNKLKDYAEKFQIDISRVDELSEALGSYYCGLKDEVNKYTDLLTFDIIPIIDKDPLSKQIFWEYLYRNPESEGSNDHMKPEYWLEPVLCYFIVKGYLNYLEVLYSKKDNFSEEELEKLNDESIRFDGVILGTCGSDIEHLVERCYPNSNYFSKYITFFND
jgi:hypothetical protein